MKYIPAIFLLCCTLSVPLQSQIDAPDKTRPRILQKNAGLPRYNVLNINRLTTWHRSDGQSNHSPQSDAGLRFPRKTASVIYQDGLIWGAKAFVDAGLTIPAPNGQPIRVGGATYGVGTRAGPVLGTGGSAVPSDPNAPEARMYRIRRNYRHMANIELRKDAADYFEIDDGNVTSGQMAEILAQYEKDWSEWPVHLGAPYIERNGIPGYQQPPPFTDHFTVDSLMPGNYDEPGISGPDTDAPAGQVMWTVFNDLNQSQSLSLFLSLPLGLEVQKTVWAYENTGALDLMYFVQYVIINKGGVDVSSDPGFQGGQFFLDSMFVSQWSDPDLGSLGNDLAGCDSTLDLGFLYNAASIDSEFEWFKLTPPAVGYVMLQGPAVLSPGDTAIVDFQRVANLANHKMTSFAPISDVFPEQLPSYSSISGNVWKSIRGFRNLGGFQTPDFPYGHGPFPASKFPLSGDPVSGTGFLDGLGVPYSFAPGDRRFYINSGPFSLSPGERQQIIVACVVGHGPDRLSSVSLMKANTRTAKQTHRQLFSIPRPPPSPLVALTELDREIILDWGTPHRRVQTTEQDTIVGRLVFEGYNVYQLPGPDPKLEGAHKIATFDVQNLIWDIIDEVHDDETNHVLPRVVQSGRDSGIRRSIRITRDFISQPPGTRNINNGQTYYYAVTAYNRSLDPALSPGSLESLPIVVKAVPRIPFGVRVSFAHGDMLPVVRVSGSSDGTVLASVVSPTSTSGHDYRIMFRDGAESTVWDLINWTTGEAKVQSESRQSGDGSFAIVDGIQFKVSGPPLDFKDFWETANSAGPHSPTYASFRINGSGFPSTLGPAAPPFDRPRPNPQGASWGIHIGDSTGDFTYAGFRRTITANGSTWDRLVGSDYEMRFTVAGGKAAVAGSSVLMDVPFELWNIGTTENDSSDDYRVIPLIEDINANGIFDLNGRDHTISGGSNDPETDWFSWHDPVDKSPGASGYQSWQSSGGTSGLGLPLMTRMVLVSFNGGNVPGPYTQTMPPAGTIYRILTTRPNTPDDIFSVTAPAVLRGIEFEKVDAQRVGVFPNPYYGSRREQETNAWRRFVTFNNLPPRVTIRIFNLAGHLVKTLEKDVPSQFLEWDLTNADNWQVASGIYICYVEMPDIGETKVLKVAVIQTQILPPY